MNPPSYPHRPDLGATYGNPVLHADYSDPDVIRHGELFYMVASSFHCTPGLPLLRSSDLVNWTLIGYAMENIPFPGYEEVRAGSGAWAPSLRYHAGKFWIFFPLVEEGIFFVTAERIEGPWSDPQMILAGAGLIDPCPFWDDDGRAYLAHAYANSRSGKRDKIHIRPMAPDGSALLGEGKIVIDAPHHPYLEGPKLHKERGWYYILAPGGGVPTGWQVAFRSREIYGPYEEKIVLEQGSTAVNGPHQGALVDLPNGEWWFLHFQDAGPYGRITHLQPVRWEDDWPLMGVDYDGNGVGEPVPSWRKPSAPRPVPESGLAAGDAFDGPALALAWQWQANHAPGWASLSERPGWLRLPAHGAPGNDLCRFPRFLSQKYPARRFAVVTRLDAAGLRPGETAGLAVVGGGEFSALAFRRTDAGGDLVLLFSGGEEKIASVPALSVCFRVAVNGDGGHGFAYAVPPGSRFEAVPRAFHAKAGGWIGAKVGLFSLAPAEGAGGGFADFDAFRFEADGASRS